MIRCKRGDIILVDFGFSEGIGSKRRPALIISSDNYHRVRHEVIIAAITHNIKRILFGDTVINGWKEAGLLYESLVTGIIRTIKDNMILQRLGTLTQQDFKRVQENFRKIIG